MAYFETVGQRSIFCESEDAGARVRIQVDMNTCAGSNRPHQGWLEWAEPGHSSAKVRATVMGMARHLQMAEFS